MFTSETAKIGTILIIIVMTIILVKGRRRWDGGVKRTDPSLLITSNLDG